MRRVLLATNALCARGLQRRWLASRRRRVVVAAGGGHPRNAFRGTYDFPRLVAAHAPLAKFVIPAAESRGGRDTVDFGDAEAVRALNAALLAADYGVDAWDLPEGALCPPVPSRADYVHHVADVLAEGRKAPPEGRRVVGLDVGCGASLVYPLLGAGAYGWSWLASESDPDYFSHAASIADRSPAAVDIRRQEDANAIFDGILEADEVVDFTMCNPPFYESRAAFVKANARKRSGLARNREKRNPGGGAAAGERDGSDNFRGSDAELWCAGGEVAFIERIITDSARHSRSALWHSTLLSRKARLPAVEKALARARAAATRVVATGRG